MQETLTICLNLSCFFIILALQVLKMGLKHADKGVVRLLLTSTPDTFRPPRLSEEAPLPPNPDQVTPSECGETRYQTQT